MKIKLGRRASVLGAAVMCALLGTSRVHADDKPHSKQGDEAPEAVEIKPFGGLDWDDSFATVVVKLNQLQGIHKTEVAMGRYHAPVTSAQTPRAVDAALLALHKTALAGTSAKFRTQELAANFKVYKQKGTPIQYWASTVTVTAESVLIEGILYRVTARFGELPGVNVLAPKNVTWLASAPRSAAFLVLAAVTLEVMPGNTKDLGPVFQALDAKYHFPQNNSHLDRGNTSLQVTTGTVTYARRDLRRFEDAFQTEQSGDETEGRGDQSGKF